MTNGDSNSDGRDDFGHVGPFASALGPDALSRSQDHPDYHWLNGDHDGAINFDDINPFVALLTGP
jgi:hypothetical protein